MPGILIRGFLIAWTPASLDLGYVGNKDFPAGYRLEPADVLDERFSVTFLKRAVLYRKQDTTEHPFS